MWELGDVPVIGWIGSPATEPYLADIADALHTVHRRTGARLHVISGGDPPHDRLEPFTTATRWSAESIKAIADWDIGIMPLRDGVYERAKCGYKLLQYAASGVPAVGTPIGVNDALLKAMDGLAPATVAEWAEALTTLLTESAERRAARAASGASVADAYSYATWEGAWLDAVGW
jgi:glycosyltransferase involved in cell wall biosynthesis